MNNKTTAFTLIEIMVWILIVSLVIMWWFKALSAVTIGKARLIQHVDIQKESFYFTEKLFEMIKKWWTLDYEEYFNRKVLWNITYSSWHFEKESGFWNFWNLWILWSTTYWDNFYYCRSNDWEQMTLSWCVLDFNSNSINNSWNQQRYWQYSFQFIDYNWNFDSNLWDEDWDWNIIWDDDDEYLWDWPEVFASWSLSPELYLISWDKKQRTIFRWSVKSDPNAPSSAWWCSLDSNTNIISWDWCIGTVEYLKLDWEDWWMNHDLVSSNTLYDWVVDTWKINSEFAWWINNVIAWSNSNNYWVPLFSDSINVSEFKVYAYPNKNTLLSWKNIDKSVNISPYIFVQIKLKPSWITRKKIWWEWKELDYSMTINLSDIYSQ